MKLLRQALLASVVIGLAVTATFAADKAKAEAKLKAAIAANDTAKVQEACDELIDCGGKPALDVLLGWAVKLDGGIYWQLVGAASGMRDAPALEALGKFIVDGSGAKGSLARDLLFGLQNNTSGFTGPALRIVLEKGKYDLQLMAVDQLAQIRSIETIDTLIAAYKKEAKGDAELKRRIEGALSTLTGQNLGDPVLWEGWWKENRSKGVPAREAAGGGGAGGTTSGPRKDEFEKTVERGQPKRVIVLAAVGGPEGTPEEQKAEINDFDYDHMQNVLAQHKIPHLLVKRKSFEQDPQKYLKDCYALLINCHQINKQCVCPNCQPPVGDVNNRMMRCNPKCGTHDERSYRLKKDALDAIKNWVENEGGFLYTEDWGLVETLQLLWPEKVTTGNGADKPKLVRKAKDPGPGWEQHIICKLTPSRGATSHPLMRGVWQKPRKEEPKPAPGEEAKSKERTESPAKPLAHAWQVDDESPAIDIKDKSSVIALLESEDLGKITEGSQTVAITFRAGKAEGKPKQATGPGGSEKAKGSGEWSLASKGGRVLHTMSHFGHQGGGSEDGQALFNLIVNFLLEAAKRHEGEQAGKK